MNKQWAGEILGEVYETEDGCFEFNDINGLAFACSESGTITIDADLTQQELEALVWWLDNEWRKNDCEH